MAQTPKEARLLRELEALLDSNDAPKLQKGLLKLLSAYQKQG